MYVFRGGSDGLSPYAGLTNVGGVLYGVTQGGGGVGSFGGGGTVFKLTLRGAEKVIYRFIGGSDGSDPNSALIYSGGLLYGTTYNGTVFQLSKTGSMTVLHSFTGAGDGRAPGGLITVGGVLYGTTSLGGSCPYDISGCGVAYSLTPPTTSGGIWSERVLYEFGGPSDGISPPYASTLLYYRGALYGTTEFGGNSTCVGPDPGCGTVFVLNPPATPGGFWTESLIYNLQGGSDAAYPSAGLAATSGTLYGTTLGDVFSITPSGVENVLHRFFGGPTDGQYAIALVDVQGTLYGTTQSGGSGFGTVYEVTP